MSRDIKFRTWDTIKNCYTDAFELVSGSAFNRSVRIDFDTRSGTMELFTAAHYIIELGTGLKDKNGKELFDGDVVKYLDDCCRLVIAKVKRFERFNMDDEGEPSIIAGFMLCDGIIEDVSEGELNKAIDELGDSFEIIGNIHENPELLEDEK